MKFARVRLLLSATAIGLCASACGASEFEFTHDQAGHQVLVRCFVPDGAKPDTPVIFVMHGVKRNGADYFADWEPHARASGFVLVVPEFPLDGFPGDEGYNFGNTVDASGHAVPRDQWAFSAIEPVFDEVKARTGNRRERYDIYGHSAGAQFVHRFLYFIPEARVERAVCANAGWYTLPTFDQAFPYGLNGTPVTPEALRVALGQPLVVLLGTADTDPNHRALRHTPGAEAQGPHRFARGHYFFDFARRKAAEIEAPFAWKLLTAPGIGHSDKGMAPYALKVLLAEPIPESKPTSTP